MAEVDRRLKKAIDRQARCLQQSVLEVFPGAAERTRESFSKSSVAIDKWLGVIVGRAAGTDNLAKPEFLRRIPRVVWHRLMYQEIAQALVVGRGNVSLRVQCRACLGHIIHVIIQGMALELI